MADRAWNDFWDRKKSKFLTFKRSGRCVIWRVGKRLHVVCPQDEGFRGLAPLDDYKGKFRTRSGVWTFPIESAPKVIALAEGIWGREKVTVSNHGEPR